MLAIQTTIIKRGFWPLDFCENLYLSCFLYIQYVKKRHCTSSPWNLQLSRCCNSCEDVREAYRRKGWALQDPDGIEQCKREGWAHKMEAQKNEGCKLFGYLEVNKVSDGYMGGRLPALDGMQTNWAFLEFLQANLTRRKKMHVPITKMVTPCKVRLWHNIIGQLLKPSLLSEIRPPYYSWDLDTSLLQTRGDLTANQRSHIELGKSEVQVSLILADVIQSCLPSCQGCQTSALVPEWNSTVSFESLSTGRARLRPRGLSFKASSQILIYAKLW